MIPLDVLACYQPLQSKSQEGIKADPIELSHFGDFIKRKGFQKQSFIIRLNQCMKVLLAQHLVLWLLLIS
ncbi:hypothetical protein L6164_027483 [Bauhinia variegata]|uniref:Uncharacterized protein n=1 Tax=Bauhinia variegata TaxID=167791 RepID=A0ACB9LTJ7_BAUVA|nr:hypothetical protein L6164_027483 [Bauhinia variegata]